MNTLYELKTLVDNKIKSRLKNNIGGAEIVSIVLIIIVIIGLAILFRDKITTLLESWFSRITTDAKNI